MNRFVMTAGLVTASLVVPTWTSAQRPEAVRPAGTEVQVQVTGTAGVPSDAVAVAVNVTAADAQGIGYVTGYGCGAPRPNASTLNFGPGAPVANGAILSIGTGGKVCFYVSDAAT
jgi:hypothetical protein